MGSSIIYIYIHSTPNNCFVVTYICSTFKVKNIDS